MMVDVAVGYSFGIGLGFEAVAGVVLQSPLPSVGNECSRLFIRVAERLEVCFPLNTHVQKQVTV